MSDANTVTLTKLNEVYMRVSADRGILREFSEAFSYYATGYQFNPRFKNKMWDGKIRLFNAGNSTIYIGLLDQIHKFCDLREYNLVVEETITDNTGNGRQEVSEADVMAIAEGLGGGFMPRDYQLQYILNALNKGRSLNISPTSSGKSLIIALIQQFYWQNLSERTLIVVPNVGLVLQMKSDFVEYGIEEESIHTIKAGATKITNHPIVISTWQSLQNMPKEWFRQFGVVLGDEAHLFAAKSLIEVMESMTEARLRHGFSGTIPKSSKVNQMLLEGLFGGTSQYVTTRELIDNETVAAFKIKALVLKHKPQHCKDFHAAIKTLDKMKRYPAEKAYLSNHEARNRFIVNLVKSLKGQNVLVLFEMVEKQGKVLAPMLEEIEGRKIHFLHGGVKGEERERVRKLVEEDPEKQHVILASFGVFSTGTSLKRLDAAIFASGSKSEVRVLQSVGRVLRRGNGSDDAVLYDIADDVTHGTKVNYTLEHFKERVQFYSDQEFDMKIYNIDL